MALDLAMTGNISKNRQMGPRQTYSPLWVKGSNQQNKKQLPTEWEKIFAKHISRKELLQLNNKTLNNPA